MKGTFSESFVRAPRAARTSHGSLSVQIEDGGYAPRARKSQGLNETTFADFKPAIWQRADADFTKTLDLSQAHAPQQVHTIR